MKYRVFKGHITWAYGLFFFPTTISFKEIKVFPNTRYLQKEHYLGEFSFDEKFLSIFQHNEINGKKYYFDMIYEHDDFRKE